MLCPAENKPTGIAQSILLSGRGDGQCDTQRRTMGDSKQQNQQNKSETPVPPFRSAASAYLDSTQDSCEFTDSGAQGRRTLSYIWKSLLPLLRTATPWHCRHKFATCNSWALRRECVQYKIRNLPKMLRVVLCVSYCSVINHAHELCRCQHCVITPKGHYEDPNMLIWSKIILLPIFFFLTLHFM